MTSAPNAIHFRLPKIPEFLRFELNNQLPGKMKSEINSEGFVKHSGKENLTKDEPVGNNEKTQPIAEINSTEKENFKDYPLYFIDTSTSLQEKSEPIRLSKPSEFTSKEPQLFFIAGFSESENSEWSSTPNYSPSLANTSYEGSDEGNFPN